MHRLTSLTLPPPLFSIALLVFRFFLIIFEIKFQIRTMIDWSRIFPEKLYVINHKLIVALPSIVATIHCHRIRPNIFAYASWLQSRCVFSTVLSPFPFLYLFLFLFTQSSMQWQPNVQTKFMCYRCVKHHIFIIGSWIRRTQTCLKWMNTIRIVKIVSNVKRQ